MKDTSARTRLGHQIRDLRRARGVTIASLASTIHRSIGWVSQIERGMSDVSISMLTEIANALGVQVTWFFESATPVPTEEAGMVVRRASRRTLDFHGSGIHEEILSPSLTGEILLVESTFAPGSSTGDRSRERRGAEAGVVLRGSLQLTVDGTTLILQAGDSFSFSQRGQHRCANTGQEPTVVLWVIAPAVY